jgi:hypothetical protein
MATTAAALSDRQLEDKLQKLQVEIAATTKTLDEAQRKLSAARTERQRAIDGIALGKAKEADAIRAKTTIEEIELRVESFRSLLVGQQNELAALRLDLGNRHAEANRIAHEKKFAEVVKEGEARAKRVLDALILLSSELIPAFDEIRLQLGTEFADLRGDVAALRLRELLLRISRGNEPLRDPNAHNWTLKQEGWILNDPLPRGGSLPGGGPLVLQIVSLRKKSAEELATKNSETLGSGGAVGGPVHDAGF